MKLIEDNRIKNRELGAGAKRLLNSDDEIFIVKAIQEKCTAHGRRTDMTLYADHRVKRKDLKNLANYNLSLRGKKLIESSTTVMNRGKPSNIRSHAAKAHIGNALFCTKRPPKTGENDTISTHRQRAHIKNIKHCIFDENLKNNSMYISMDDKAYLRPGTDVGFRVVKNRKLYDVTEDSLQKRLPQHDFCNPDLYQTPSSFRLVEGHLQSIDGSQ